MPTAPLYCPANTRNRVPVLGSPTYWLDLFTGTTWKDFLAAGATVSGFREGRWRTVQQIHPAITCYAT